MAVAASALAVGTSFPPVIARSESTTHSSLLPGRIELLSRERPCESACAFAGNEVRLERRDTHECYLPVFTRVHILLMVRWVAGSRAVITNSRFIVVSSG